ncbi:RNA-binding protein [Tritrichomonas foetus]|uniref:RNA-binding protein n=1 Tax=Tritrichomonas foetus TaxID=1144522 RepID=A0A1J4JZJ8_9EUKA|nr:RNA-binding protein [Tritrichomonas foetus]|eukprot:OHT04585.1 RNA-binding protein [Tritrichomonas foetus]
MSNKTIFVSNISYSHTAKELGDYFTKFGAISDARILSERFRGKLLSRGIGFVEFKDDAGFTAAVNEKNHQLGTRNLRVSPARPKVERKRDAAFLAGIPAGTTVDDIKEAFKEYHACDARIVRENSPNRRGFAFVQFPTSEDQSNAVKNNRTIKLKGEESHVRFAHGDFGAKPLRRRFRRRSVRRAPRSNQPAQNA